MASKKYKELSQFRAILMRLVEDESKLIPEIVDSLYDQVFINPIIQSYADFEINEAYFYLINLKKYYKIDGVKELQEHFKRFDTMTSTLFNTILMKPGKAKTQIEQKIEENLKNIGPDTMSVIEAIYHINQCEKTTNILPKLCEQANRSSLFIDSSVVFKEKKQLEPSNINVTSKQVRNNKMSKQRQSK